MAHLHFNITDPRWAIVVAGALSSSRTGAYKKVNSSFTYSLEKTTPLISYLSDYFEPKPVGAEDYAFPSEEQYGILDYFQAASHAKALKEQHGISQEPLVIPLYLGALATTSLLLSHGIASQITYFMPPPNKTQLASVPEIDVLLESKAYATQGKAFAQGLGIVDPILAFAEDYNDFEQVCLWFKARAIVARPHHFFHYIGRAQYRGFDFLCDATPVLSIIDETCIQDNRFLLSWNAQLPVGAAEPLDSIKAKGTAWKIRSNYGFDHRPFYKDHHTGNVRV